MKAHQFVPVAETNRRSVHGFAFARVSDTSSATWTPDLQPRSFNLSTCLTTTNSAPHVHGDISYTAPTTLADDVLDLFLRCASTLLHRPSAFVCAFTAFCYAVVVNTPPFLTAIVLALLASFSLHHLTCRITQDYQVFLSCGRGGTASTPAGWVRVTILKILANVDVLGPPYKDPSLEPCQGILSNIPIREGPRPVVRGVAPQRQHSQPTAASTFEELVRILRDKASGAIGLTVERSYLEPHTVALKAICPDETHCLPGTVGEWDFEICHPHKIDGSLHIAMHPDDAKLVVQNGWGQMHPLATTAWYWLTYHHLVRGIRLPVPPNLVFVYAPRNKADFDMIKRFIDAAAWFIAEKVACDKVRLGAAGRAPCGTTVPRKEALESGKFVVGSNNRLLNHEKALETGL